MSRFKKEEIYTDALGNVVRGYESAHVRLEQSLVQPTLATRRPFIL
jgi:hypothetical protein